MSLETPVEPKTAAPRAWLNPVDALSRLAPMLKSGAEIADRSQAQVRYGYHVGEVGLLVGLNAVCEIVTLPVVARIPTTPAWFLGVANLRGGLVPIFDLGTLIAITPKAREHARFGVIFDRGDQAVGILVSEHPKTLERLEPFSQLPPLPAALRDFVSNAFRNGPSIWLEFDHRRFFESIAKRISVFSEGEST
jgi:twitching motility protein PilI